ncbi:MAG: (2Fe-2S)-binding protein [Firmicutes bacterium]|jgi:carbon-monoxide dehydrogenase small subunit|nr:(2Fe-2S)-binding protein [Bacillota bacterium]MDH7496045.1 (2Fe-2S)-binding protein [Bacillota bacterium]
MKQLEPGAKATMSFKVNGNMVEVEVSAGDRLIDVLREGLRLTGAKEGCGIGECGACTVLLDGRAVNSCLVPAMQAEGREVETVEGLAKDGRLHPLQEAFIEHTAVQCGFCTPGMLMSAAALIRENPHPTREEIARAISGNLCRCTGYHQIISAIEDAARRMSQERFDRSRLESSGPAVTEDLGGSSDEHRHK